MKVFGLNYERQVRIGEHIFVKPEPPKKKEDILFFNESYENAHWKRKTDYPEFWHYFSPYKTLVDKEATLYNEDRTELVELSKADTKIIREIYKSEINNRLNGVFFKNGDDLEWLSGSNWFTLQHCKMFGNSKNGGYGMFYQFQQHVFYLLEHMWQDWCLGLDISKAKKTGITQILDGGYCVDLATRKEEWLIAFMSRNEGVAIDNNMKLFLYAFDSLPLPLKPRVGFRATKGGSIDFAERGKLNSPKTNSTDVLNTKVFCVPTSEHSFDSHFMNIIRMDEFGKYWVDSKQEPKEIFRNNKAGAKDQDFFRGRIILSGYPPEQDDIGSKQAEEVFLESELSTMKYGKTKSELICWHIPAYKSLKSCIDKYGKCDERKAMQIIMENRDRVKGDKKAYLAEVRQNPNDKMEAFGSGGATSVFDTVYLNQCKFELLDEINSTAVPLWKDGWLVWDNPLWEVGKKDKRPPGVFCPVKFVQITEQEILDGKKPSVRIYRDLLYEHRNLPLRLGRDDLGNLLAPEKFNGVIGGDPINYADNLDVEEGSMQSLKAMNMHDERLNSMNREIVTKIFQLEYFDRPELGEAAYQDLVKFIIYTGYLSLIEGNSPTFFTRLMNEGLGNYMIVRHKDGYLTKWDISMDKGDYKSVKRTKNASQNEIMEMIIEVIKGYTFRSEDDAMNQYAKTIKSVRFFEQACKFTPDNTKEFDDIMSSGYCLIAYEVYRSILAQVKDGYYDEVAIRALFAATERA